MSPYYIYIQTRIQVSSDYGKLGMFGTAMKVSSDEGVLALWKGVNAAWMREASYTSLRLGLYEPVKVVFGAGDPATATFLKKFLAGSAAGAIGSLAGSKSTKPEQSMSAGTQMMAETRVVFHWMVYCTPIWWALSMPPYKLRRNQGVECS